MTTAIKESLTNISLYAMTVLGVYLVFVYPCSLPTDSFASVDSFSLNSLIPLVLTGFVMGIPLVSLYIFPMAVAEIESPSMLAIYAQFLLGFVTISNVLLAFGLHLTFYSRVSFITLGLGLITLILIGSTVIILYRKRPQQKIANFRLGAAITLATTPIIFTVLVLTVDTIPCR